MGHTIQETTETVFIGNYIHRVNVIKGSLYSRVYGRLRESHSSTEQSGATPQPLLALALNAKHNVCQRLYEFAIE